MLCLLFTIIGIYEFLTTAYFNWGKIQTININKFKYLINAFSLYMQHEVEPFSQPLPLQQKYLINLTVKGR